MMSVVQGSFMLRQNIRNVVLSTATKSSVNIQQVGIHHKHDQQNAISHDGESSKSPGFARAKRGTFFQDEPHLENTYLGDAFLRRNLKRLMPIEIFDAVDEDLKQFGYQVATHVYKLSRECETNPPYIKHYNGWGKRIDEIVTCQAWKDMKDISAKEGLVAIAYEREQKEWSRLYQIAKLFLYHPSSGLYSCPLAMTDGAAKTIEALQLTTLSDVFKHLTTRNTEEFWTSGQWMTERKGGSDVGSGTETVAVPAPGGKFRLYGYKWFSSATDADMALTLARIADDGLKTTEGSKGLSMFYAKLEKNDDGGVNGVEVIRLKDKLGTRQLPTAELLLDGMPATLVSAPGRGVASIANMLTITRLHNAVASIAAVRRIVSLARDYSMRRRAFGELLHKSPLHIRTMSHLEIECRGMLLLMLETAMLLGREEAGTASDTEKLVLRLITPVLKLYAGKMCIPLVSEGMECFGGAGYLEDTGIPGILRDVQVTPIWEGTTNILSLDVLRAIHHSQGEVLTSLLQYMMPILEKAATHPELNTASKKVERSLKASVQFISENQESAVVAARDFAFSIAQSTIGTLLLQHALSSHATKSDVLCALRWCERDMSQVSTNHSQGHYSVDSSSGNHDLVFDGYSEENLLGKLF